MIYDFYCHGAQHHLPFILRISMKMCCVRIFNHRKFKIIHTSYHLGVDCDDALEYINGRLARAQAFLFFIFVWRQNCYYSSCRVPLKVLELDITMINGYKLFQWTIEYHNITIRFQIGVFHRAFVWITEKLFSVQ